MWLGNKHINAKNIYFSVLQNLMSNIFTFDDHHLHPKRSIMETSYHGDPSKTCPIWYTPINGATPQKKLSCIANILDISTNPTLLFAVISAIKLSKLQLPTTIMTEVSVFDYAIYSSTCQVLGNETCLDWQQREWWTQWCWFGDSWLFFLQKWPTWQNSALTCC